MSTFARKRRHREERKRRGDPENLVATELDCFVAPTQNSFAILSWAPRNDAYCERMPTGSATGVSVEALMAH